MQKERQFVYLIKERIINLCHTETVQGPSEMGGTFIKINPYPLWSMQAIPVLWERAKLETRNPVLSS